MMSNASLRQFSLTDRGYYVGEIVGLGLTAKEELALLDQKGLPVADSARDLLSSGASVYNAEHRLEKSWVYEVALFPAVKLREYLQIEPDKPIPYALKTNANYLGMSQQFGYPDTPAELQLRLHGRLLVPWLKKLDVQWVAVIHQPITNQHGHPEALYSRFYGPDFTLTTDSGSPLREWHDKGLIAAVKQKL